jgi:hypothetical protein
MYTREQIEKAVKSKKYVWFESNTDFDINIVGVRNASTGQTVTNVFDDTITLSYKEKGVWKFHSWPATTDPGKKGVLELEKIVLNTKEILLDPPVRASESTNVMRFRVCSLPAPSGRLGHAI